MILRRPVDPSVIELVLDARGCGLVSVIEPVLGCARLWAGLRRGRKVQRVVSLTVKDILKVEGWEVEYSLARALHPPSSNDWGLGRKEHILPAGSILICLRGLYLVCFFESTCLLSAFCFE